MHSALIYDPTVAPVSNCASKINLCFLFLFYACKKGCNNYKAADEYNVLDGKHNKKDSLSLGDSYNDAKTFIYQRLLKCPVLPIS